jgi:hypothetical protein
MSEAEVEELVLKLNQIEVSEQGYVALHPLSRVWIPW